MVKQAQNKVSELAGNAKDNGLTCMAYKKCQTATGELLALTQRLGQANTKAAALDRAKQAPL